MLHKVCLKSSQTDGYEIFEDEHHQQHNEFAELYYTFNADRVAAEQTFKYSRKLIPACRQGDAKEDILRIEFISLSATTTGSGGIMQECLSILPIYRCILQQLLQVSIFTTSKSN